MSHLDRILHDGIDREGWKLARQPCVGASDAAKLAKESSIESVLKEKLTRREWNGNAYTEQGHRWEPMMLAWAGISPNIALIHSPENRGFAATPDGADATRGAECKAKHNKVVTGPTLGEWRQVAWQFVVVPEFEEIEFIWQELVTDPTSGLWIPRADEPKNLTIPRDHPKIVDLTSKILPLATDLLDRLTRALEFEREMNAA